MAQSSGSIIAIVWTAARKWLRQPAFLVAAGLLLLAAIGLNGAVAELKLHFNQLPCALTRPLADIPPLMGPWFQVSRDEPLNPDLQEVLGTDKYIYRDYINLQAHDGQCAADLLELFYPKKSTIDRLTLRNQFLTDDLAGRAAMLDEAMTGFSAQDRKEALGRVQYDYPDAAVNLGVTYYTGFVDTVAHVPDRCYIASGFEQVSYDIPTWMIDSKKLAVRLIQFQGNNGISQLYRNVCYFFHVNGHYESDPYFVRLSLQDLFEKYGYYLKVELMTIDTDHNRSAATMRSFLSSALPEIEKCYPDWYRLHHPNGK